MCDVHEYFRIIYLLLCLYLFFLFLQAYKTVVNDTSVFRLEIPMKNKG